MKNDCKLTISVIKAMEKQIHPTILAREVQKNPIILGGWEITYLYGSYVCRPRDNCTIDQEEDYNRLSNAFISLQNHLLKI